MIQRRRPASAPAGKNVPHETEKGQPYAKEIADYSGGVAKAPSRPMSTLDVANWETPSRMGSFATGAAKTSMAQFTPRPSTVSGRS